MMLQIHMVDVLVLANKYCRLSLPKTSVSDLSRLTALAAMFFLFFVSACSHQRQGPTQVESGSAQSEEDLVLFSFDDFSIPWRDNLKLTLEEPKKHPANPVFRPGRAGSVDDIGAILYGTILRQGDRFRMWYVPWFQPDPRFPSEAGLTETQTMGYAESSDGIHWERPNLGLVEFRGSKNNNLILIEPREEEFAHPMNFLSVLFEPQDADANRRYKMVYCVRPPSKKYVTIGTAVSPDGLRWKLMNNVEFTRGHFEVSSLVRFNGTYYVSGQNLYPFGGHLPDGTPAGRTMTAFYSPDFIHWSGGRALSFFRSNYEPKPMNHGQEVHMGAGLWNRGNVIVGLYGRWYGDTIKDEKHDPFKTPSRQWNLGGLKIDLGLILSNDGIHYREPVRDFIVVRHGNENEWDSEAIEQANAFYNTETETYIWYSHADFSIPRPMPPAPEKVKVKPMGVGLVTMRRDGFGYLSKFLTAPVETWRGKWDHNQASFVTRSIQLRHSSQLFVNVEGASSNAPLQIDLVDDTERPLPGYQAMMLTNNSVKGLVRWKEKERVPSSTPFRIRVTWPQNGSANPRVYALYLEQGSSGQTGR